MGWGRQTDRGRRLVREAVQTRQGVVWGAPVRVPPSAPAPAPARLPCSCFSIFIFIVALVAFGGKCVITRYVDFLERLYA